MTKLRKGKDQERGGRKELTLLSSSPPEICFNNLGLSLELKPKGVAPRRAR